MKRLSKSEIKALADLPVPPSKKDAVIRDEGTLRINNVLSYFHMDEHWVPTIPLLLNNPDIIPQVVVDMGAIKHVVNGADIMRPGITQVPDAPKGTFVAIVDETHGKPIAVGQLLEDGKTIEAATAGKLVKNVHHVGDELWEKRQG